ncbi:unnamed protein product [Amoebophrya sp. A25]|nr:unnamed protein product [Amoebophrya sp. A25]|eukprot:GSA25T00019359001.1
MAASSSSTMPSCTATTAKVHPLVLLNVSDHMTRKSETEVVGVLLGAYAADDSRVVEVLNSFEVKTEDAEPGTTGSRMKHDPESSPLQRLDHAYLQQRLRQYAEVFPRMEMMGYYIGLGNDVATAQSDTSSADMTSSILSYAPRGVASSDSGQYLLVMGGSGSGKRRKANSSSSSSSGRTSTGLSQKMDGLGLAAMSTLEQPGQPQGSSPSASSSTLSDNNIREQEKMPIRVFEKSTVDTWTPVSHTLESTEIERVAVQHVSAASTNASQFADHGGTVLRSIGVLRSRLDILIDYLGSPGPKDAAVLRGISLICSQLQRQKGDGHGGPITALLGDDGMETHQNGPLANGDYQTAENPHTSTLALGPDIVNAEMLCYLGELTTLLTTMQQVASPLP